MVSIGQVVEVKISGWSAMWRVTAIATCPFGTTLQEGFQDVTTPEDQAQGIRVGIKGTVVK